VTEPRRAIELTDPRALRAVAHPLRLRLVGLLRREGPLTATKAGEVLGESPASCSFHLRQLAKYGLVEEAGGGHGRERPWRATAQFTSWPLVARDPELGAAAELLSKVVAERYFEQIFRWLEARADDPADWQEAAIFGDRMLYLTSSELAELEREIKAVLEPYAERTATRALRPEDARLVTLILAAFPQHDET
jgi:DNA-binding transcriptional ArsR family regulator